MLEETQGSDVQGRSIMVDFTGAKSRQSSKGPGEFNLLTYEWFSFFLIFFVYFYTIHNCEQ